VKRVALVGVWRQGEAHTPWARVRIAARTWPGCSVAEVRAEPEATANPV